MKASIEDGISSKDQTTATRHHCAYTVNTEHSWDRTPLGIYNYAICNRVSYVSYFFIVFLSFQFTCEQAEAYNGATLRLTSSGQTILFN